MDSQNRPPSPNDCPTIDKLHAFCQGMLTPSDVESISKHVQRCERCASLLVDYSIGGAAAQPSQPVTAETIAETVSYRSARGPVEYIGRYRIIRVIGRGGFGTVHLAHDGELDRLVAVKVPHPERIREPADLEAYHREARLHAAIDHPHVVPIYDVGRSEAAPFYAVSKFVPGMNLGDRLRQVRPDHRTAASWVATIANALDHIHNQNLIHRDVKPRNVMIGSDGQPYLMDFGLAKVRLASAAAGQIGVVGTPGYMSPEQARGDGALVDHRADIYSLGVVLYELLTGHRPFHGTPTEILHQTQSIEATPPRRVNPKIPRDLEKICVKALAQHPAARYQRAADLAADLQCFLRGEPPCHARRVGHAETVWLWIVRHRTLSALAATASMAILLAGFAWLRPADHARPFFKVSIQTEPPRAAVYYFPLDLRTRLPQPAQGKRAPAGAVVELFSGYHLVVAVLPDGRFHEVLRLVPDDPAGVPEAHRHHRFDWIDGIIYLRSIDIPDRNVADGMSLVPGSSDFVMGSKTNPAFPVHRRRVPSFYLDPKEVTIGAYRKRMTTFAYPAGMETPPDDFPVAFVSWDDAVAHAEVRGKRLPDEAEFEYAATALGAREFPWGEVKINWTFEAAGKPAFDQVAIDGQPAIFSLNSNVAEWTGSLPSLYPGEKEKPVDARKRVVRGGPFSVIKGIPDDQVLRWSPRDQIWERDYARQRGLGFRCARSAKPRIQPEDFIAILP